jgi:hypothetical protein
MSQPNPNMTYEELQQQVAELLRDMYHPSDQILKEDVPKLIQLFAAHLSGLRQTIRSERIVDADVGYDCGFNAGIDVALKAFDTLAQLTTKNTEEENV